MTTDSVSITQQTERRYTFARAMVWVLRGLGALAVLVSAFVVVFLAAAFGGSGNEFGEFGFIWFGLLQVAEGFVAGVVLIACAEGLNLLIGIEENTRSTRG